jgi:hypothetical protein
MKINDIVLVDKFEDKFDGCIGRVKSIENDTVLVSFDRSNDERWFHKAYLNVMHATLPYDDVLKFVEHIQRIKDIYNDGNKEILNYGMLCDLCIEGWNLVK